VRLVENKDGWTLIARVGKAIGYVKPKAGGIAMRIVVDRVGMPARPTRCQSAREIAQIGAVIGRGFSYRLLLALVGVEESTLPAALERLAEADIRVEGGRTSGDRCPTLPEPRLRGPNQACRGSFIALNLFHEAPHVAEQRCELPPFGDGLGAILHVVRGVCVSPILDDQVALGHLPPA
jgi:hypothetical protein